MGTEFLLSFSLSLFLSFSPCFPLFFLSFPLLFSFISVFYISSVSSSYSLFFPRQPGEGHRTTRSVAVWRRWVQDLGAAR